MQKYGNLIGIVILLVMAAGGPSFGSPFRNTSNAPFATRCNGPQGAIIIADDAVSSSAARASAVATQHPPGKLAHCRRTIERLRLRGLVGPRTQVRLPRLAVHMREGKLVLPDLVSSAAVGDLGDPANQLTFEYEGWTDPERAALDAYLAIAYPKARLIYGPPAFNITVKIIRDDSITDLQGGIYDATTNEIRMPSLTGNVPEDTFILMMLVLRAFHDDVALFYDAWEEGFSGAAATAVQIQPGVSAGFDPKDPGPFYALSVYEAENHAALGNSTFYPEGDFAGMLVWRVAMARAAWMKCWIEDNGFFAAFNQRYYAAFAAGMQGDVPRLRELAAEALPTVEGLPFQEWFERQYVLDTSVRTGLKEYTWNIPLSSAVALICEHYLTDAAGNESARGGQAKTVYWSYNFAASLYAEEGNLIDVPVVGDTPGEGFLIPTFFNIGGPQRITVQLDINGLRSYYIFPYSVRGFEVGESNLYGGILGETTGEMNVVGGDGITGLNVRRGVWGGIIQIGELSPLRLTATFTNSDGQEITRQVNVGWDSYVLFLDGGAQTTVTHTFGAGTTGLHLMSLPVNPVGGSAAETLGISASDLLLARWNAAAPSGGKYDIWPDCEPFALGRGFWLRVLADAAVEVTGVKAADEERIYVPLELGWNIFGPVRMDTMPIESLKIQVGTEPPAPLADAVTARYVQNGIFGYEESGGYSLVDEIAPFGGYWIRALTPGGCRLVFEPVGAASAAAARAAPLPRPAWRLPLVVEAGRLRSSAAYLGGAKDGTDGVESRYDLQAPPSFGPVVSARFIRKENGREAAYMTDVRGENPVGATWDFEVRSTVAGERVRVSWPDLSELPGGLRPTLVDVASGKRLYMRTTPGYTVGGDAGAWRLRIEMAEAGTGPLMVSSMSARAGVERASVAYTLSRDAAVRVRVLNIAGRSVRTLAGGGVEAAGAHVVTWNLRDDRGTKTPSGLYLFEIEARAEDGQAVRRVCTMRVNRR